MRGLRRGDRLTGAYYVKPPWGTLSRPWRASIRCGRHQNKHLGYFGTEALAHAAWAKAAAAKQNNKEEIK